MGLKTLVECAHELVQANARTAQDAYSKYDQLLWTLCTASKEEIDAFTQELYTEPLIQVPPPIQVVAFRLLGLEHIDSPAHRQAARAGIDMYCDPVAVENACHSFRD